MYEGDDSVYEVWVPVSVIRCLCTIQSLSHVLSLAVSLLLPPLLLLLLLPLLLQKQYRYLSLLRELTICVGGWIGIPFAHCSWLWYWLTEYCCLEIWLDANLPCLRACLLAGLIQCKNDRTNYLRFKYTIVFLDDVIELCFVWVNNIRMYLLLLLGRERPEWSVNQGFVLDSEPREGTGVSLKSFLSGDSLHC